VARAGRSAQYCCDSPPPIGVGVDPLRQLGDETFVPLLLLNTTRFAPGPQAREPLSLWTEVWPTQPVLTQRTRVNTSR